MENNLKILKVLSGYHFLEGVAHLKHRAQSQETFQMFLQTKLSQKEIFLENLRIEIKNKILEINSIIDEKNLLFFGTLMDGSDFDPQKIQEGYVKLGELGLKQRAGLKELEILRNNYQSHLNILNKFNSVYKSNIFNPNNNGSYLAHNSNSNSLGIFNDIQEYLTYLNIDQLISWINLLGALTILLCLLSLIISYLTIQGINKLKLIQRYPFLGVILRFKIKLSTYNIILHILIILVILLLIIYSNILYLSHF